MDAWQTNRRGDVGKVARAKTFGFKPVFERGPLRVAAYQSNERQILMFSLTLQASGHHIQVFGMAKAHDQNSTARC